MTAPLAARRRRAAWIGTAVAVIGFWLVATAGQPWRLFDVGPFSSNFFDTQAHSLLAGRLDVPAGVMGIEGFTVNGVTHMYFGLGPALLRLPFALFGEATDGRLGVASQLLAVALLALASARLLTRAERSVLSRVNGSDDTAATAEPETGDSSAEPAPARGVVWPWMLFPAATALATPVLFLASRPLVYHEAELWGAAAALASLELALVWWDDRRTIRLAAAAAAAAFAISCRPSSGSAGIVALGLFALICLWRRELRTAALALGSAALASASYVAINVIRFGTLMSIPFDAQVYTSTSPARQAALDANGGTLFGLQFLPTTMWQYLSPLPTSIRVERLAPFIDWSGRATVFNGVRFDTVDRSTSLWLAAPIFVVLAVIGSWWVLRKNDDHGWRVISVAAAIGTVGAFAIGFIAHRYLVDMVPVLVVLAAPGFWVAWRWQSRRQLAVRRVVAVVAVALTLVGATTQGALAIRGHFLSVHPTAEDRLGFIEWRYGLDERLFHGRPPSVTVLDEAPDADQLPDLPEGQLVVVGDCDALYFVEHGTWQGIEWAPGSDRRQVIAPTRRTADELRRHPVEMASGPGWTIVARPVEGGEVRLHLLVPALQLDVAGVPVELDEDSVVEIIGDPTIRQFSVAVDGTDVLGTTFLPVTEISPSPGWRQVRTASPWCRSLLDRLPPSG